MNLDDYEKTHAKAYAEFAELVADLIRQAIVDAKTLPIPVATGRAKGPSSLRKKLEDRKLLESDRIEHEIKDLAGVRLIFYTNTDVNRFLQSRLIPENFAVDWEEVKVHHPTEENKQTRYQAIHYIVSLGEPRALLPEYRRFAGMRCEIQVQTILNHAWSETTHDMLYKARSNPGFGTAAAQGLEKRLKRIMDDYLRPAGFEFQKAQHDYERLMEGKTLFDRDAFETLNRCEDNNERHDVLEKIFEFVLPNYDDITGIFPDLIAALRNVVRAAQSSATKEIATELGNVPGKTAKDVVSLAVQVVDAYRYVDVESTLRLLISIFDEVGDEGVRATVVRAVEHLARYDRGVWKKVGIAAQLAVADAIDRLHQGGLSLPREISLAIWREILSANLRGTTFSANNVTLHQSALPVGDQLRDLRSRAIDTLVVLFRASATDTEHRQAFSALRECADVPTQANYSNELLRLTIENSIKVVGAIAGVSAQLSYEVLQHIEHEFLLDYRRANQLADDPENRFQCHEAARALTIAIVDFRDTINADATYVRHKTLVGFNSTFPPHWGDDNLSPREVAEYRLRQADIYVGQLSAKTADACYALIKRCAQTRSEDLATFPIFAAFLTKLATAHPVIVMEFLKRNDLDVLQFLPAILDGLAQGNALEEYQTLVENLLSSGSHLLSVAKHCRSATAKSTREIVPRLTQKAIELGDVSAVFECMRFAIERPGDKALVTDVFVPGVEFARVKGDARWIFHCSFLQECAEFFPALSAKQAEAVLENLLALTRIEHNAERILTFIAKGHASSVWSFFEQRIRDKRESEAKYEAMPFRFFGLEAELSRSPKLAVSTLRKWYSDGDVLFRFTGGRLLHAVFPTFDTALADELNEMVATGTPEDWDFLVHILENYVGEPATHETIKRVIDVLPEDERTASRIDVCLMNTGVVTGEFGFVEAYRKKKSEIEGWLIDARPKVQRFAAGLVKRLERQIANEQRSAEADTELRALDYGEDTE